VLQVRLLARHQLQLHQHSRRGHSCPGCQDHQRWVTAVRTERASSTAACSVAASMVMAKPFHHHMQTTCMQPGAVVPSRPYAGTVFSFCKAAAVTMSDAQIAAACLCAPPPADWIKSCRMVTTSFSYANKVRAPQLPSCAQKRPHLLCAALVQGQPPASQPPACQPVLPAEMGTCAAS
jgi:hypothetical protein